jgi:hypothetical protein
MAHEVGGWPFAASSLYTEEARVPWPGMAESWSEATSVVLWMAGTDAVFERTTLSFGVAKVGDIAPSLLDPGV